MHDAGDVPQDRVLEVEVVEHRLKAAVAAVVGELHAPHVERGGVGRHIPGVVDEHELGVGVDAAADQPGAGRRGRRGTRRGSPTSRDGGLLVGRPVRIDAWRTARSSAVADRWLEVIPILDPGEALAGVARHGGAACRRRRAPRPPPGLPRSPPPPPLIRAANNCCWCFDPGTAVQVHASPLASTTSSAIQSSCSRFRAVAGRATRPSTNCTAPSRRSLRHTAILGVDGSRGSRYARRAHSSDSGMVPSLGTLEPWFHQPAAVLRCTWWRTTGWSMPASHAGGRGVATSPSGRTSRSAMPARTVEASATPATRAARLTTGPK